MCNKVKSYYLNEEFRFYLDFKDISAIFINGQKIQVYKNNNTLIEFSQSANMYSLVKNLLSDFKEYIEYTNNIKHELKIKGEL